MTADLQDLAPVLTEVHADHPTPAAALGVWREGKISSAFVGVTSVENPLPVDASTLFQIGSISKTYTATAVMHLVSTGRVALEAPVRDYLPELHLQDETVAETVTIRHLLNHTAGWDGTMTSGGDDPEASLEQFVATTLPRLDQTGPMGRRPEYNNAALALAGRVVEVVTGMCFEQAVRTLLLTPLGLTDTYFSNEDLITERVTVGHMADDAGRYSVARPWRWPRAGNPEGGLVATVEDALRWAAFHLGDGRAPDGTDLVAAKWLHLMRTPTARLVGNVMGDGIGLGWFLRSVAGTTTFGHQGTTNGQFAELRLVPDREYAVVVCANGGPAGTQLTRSAIDTLLARDLGLADEPRPPRPYDPEHDGDVAGRFANNLAFLDVVVREGIVQMTYSVRPEHAASLGNPAFPPAEARFLPGDDGEYVIVGGSFDGTTGSIARDAEGRVTEIDFGGRWHRRDA